MFNSDLPISGLTRFVGQGASNEYDQRCGGTSTPLREVLSVSSSILALTKDDHGEVSMPGYKVPAQIDIRMNRPTLKY